MVAAAVLVQFFALAQPVFYIVIFDRVFGRQNLSTLDVIGFGVLVILIFDILVKTLRAHLMTYQLEWLNKLTAGYYLDRLFGARLNDMDETGSPLSEQFSELIRINQGMTVTLMMALLDSLLSLIIVAVLFFLNPFLALVSLLPLIPICLMVFFEQPAAKKRALAFHKDQRTCQYRLAEVLRSGETLQSLNATGVKKQEMGNSIRGFLEGGFKTHLDQIGAGNMQGFLINVGSIITLYAGAHLVLQGEMSYGVYLAINMLSRTVLGSLQKLVAALAQMVETMGATEQLQSLFAKPMAKEAPKNLIRLEKSQGLMAFHNVSFRYADDGPWVLQDLSLTIKPGERVVLTGKSGAGKTTLIRLMQRLYEPSKGYLTLDGYNLADMDEQNLREHVVVALQKPAIFSGTVFDNIALAKPGATKKEVVEAVKLAQFDEAVFDFEEGLDSPVNPFGLNLSGGEVSRIAVARLFLTTPAVVALDEALANVPPATGVAILNNVHKYFRQATCVFVSNFIPLHQSVDRIVVIDEGRVVEEGAFKDLVEKKGHYFRLFDPGARLSPRSGGGH